MTEYSTGNIGGKVTWNAQEVDANSTNSGIACWDTSGNAIVLSNPFIWSITGAGFLPPDGTITEYSRDDANFTSTRVATLGVYAPVSLPNNVTIVEVKVLGSDSTNTWSLFRSEIGAVANQSSIASGVVNTADTTISNQVVNNLTHRYILSVNLDQNDKIYGAYIKYNVV